MTMRIERDMRPGWPVYALGLAEAAAIRSEDPYCKVGAVVLGREGITLGSGYNGPPSGVALDWSDREGRRPFIIHAEANALRYTTPREASGGLLAVTHGPCAPCVVLAASYGISEVWYQRPPADESRYPMASINAVALHLGIRLQRATLGEQQ